MLKLEEECRECKGSGYIQSPAWAEFWEKHGTEMSNEDWDKADKPNEPEEYVCDLCSGYGMAPTAEGEMLLRFLERHLKS